MQRKSLRKFEGLYWRHRVKMGSWVVGKSGPGGGTVEEGTDAARPSLQEQGLRTAFHPI